MSLDIVKPDEMSPDVFDRIVERTHELEEELGPVVELLDRSQTPNTLGKWLEAVCQYVALLVLDRDYELIENMAAVLEIAADLAKLAETIACHVTPEQLTCTALVFGLKRDGTYKKWELELPTTIQDKPLPPGSLQHHYASLVRQLPADEAAGIITFGLLPD